MSQQRRHLRFMISSALLVGPALGCGGPEPEVNAVGPTETPTETTTDEEIDEAPNVNVPPIDEPPHTMEPSEDLGSELSTNEVPAPPTSQLERTPRVNNRPSHPTAPPERTQEPTEDSDEPEMERTPVPLPERRPNVNTRPDRAPRPPEQ